VKESEKELFDVTKAKTKIEDRSTIRLGSIDLIRFLLDTNPNINFTMLLGADTYQDLEAGKWKSGDELMRLIRFVVMDREGYTNISEQKTPSSSCENVEFISIPSLGPVSSTMARQAKDYETLSTIVVPSVANYIIEHQLYAFSPDQTN
jgi:nicotinic acid mononucleotide adenylyltransferase